MSNLLAQLISLRNIFGNLYIADFFDVLIIALLIYITIFLFKQTRSFYVAAGVGIIIALFVLARVFNLFLTTLALQAFFGVFFVALVVIFQEELRKFFEYLALWSRRQVERGSRATLTIPGAEEILNAVKQLAHDSIGALIILQGQDSLENYISGGITLDGVISEELLLSIFDPTSAGHDGAVLINMDRVSFFGGHLPLSHNFEQIGKRGTRHSAGLGISEASDAFAIIVSEEKGTVSYAYNGRLKLLKNARDLHGPMLNFLKEKFPEQAHTILENLIKRNSLEKLLSIFAATILWFFFAFQVTTVQRDFILPITYKNTSDIILIKETKPKEVSVTLSARGETAFDLLDQKTLAVSLDASNLTKASQKVSITEDMISTPLNFSVVNIVPQEIEVSAQRVSLIDLPIEVKTKGKVAAGYVIREIAASPASLKVMVPEGARSLSSIALEPIDITNLRSSQTFLTKIILPQDVKLKNKTDLDVSVSIEVGRL
ncbi:MAG: DNA integrity scanning protein DisA nucleotide-binding domain protein [Candidatus Liptonbacteria bacterium]|nr:DNA integrity scanning protein DisA nucleotide-binding domain protein [Candidatus Liptonbacteria bacterium]